MDTPGNDGHCLVILKTHYPTIFETPPENSPVALTRSR
jgi:diadenosine tetraphosphate (Ap4A) HIT family hydrolase